MAKGNPNKVAYNFGEMILRTGKDMNSLYSEAVQLSWKLTGKLSPGFDAKDLMAWVRKYFPNLYNEKGNRIS